MGRSVPDVKKKWLDLNAEAKKRLACHRQRMSATGGGKKTPEPRELDAKKTQNSHTCDTIMSVA